MLSLVLMHIAKWVSIRKEFDSSRVEGIFHNWEASLYCRRSKERLEGGLKFNVEGSARGKPGPAGVGGVHRTY